MKECKKCIHESVCGKKYAIARLVPNGAELPCDDFLSEDGLPAMETGTWEICCDSYYPYCSKCGYEPPRVRLTDMRTKYCPNCGKPMKRIGEY